MLSKLTARFHHITAWAGILPPNEALNQNCLQGALSSVIGKLNYNSLNFMIPGSLAGGEDSARNSSQSAAAAFSVSKQ